MEMFHFRNPFGKKLVINMDNITFIEEKESFLLVHFVGDKQLKLKLEELNAEAKIRLLGPDLSAIADDSGGEAGHAI